MRRAFISHSTTDDRYVAEMESFLRAAGFDDVFNDVSSIRPDEQFWPEIQKGIADCDSLVVVITSASNDSEWVKREVEYARSLSRRVIPVWIEDCPIPPLFTERDVIDFRPRTRSERRIDIDRVVKYAPAELIGREDETRLLNEAWGKVLRTEKCRPHVLTFVALGGEGKTSLVAKWAAELAAQDWPGCDSAFAWSFYSQGTRDQAAASSDLFLKEALNFFATGTEKEVQEIQEFAASPAGAFEKGQRLARIVGQRRSLLILDGLEPLQYAPTSPTPGQLKDQGVAALLKGLAASSRGLCVVTTRYSLPDLKAFKDKTVVEKELKRLSQEAGVHLLQQLGVRKESGSKADFEKLVEDVKGHALTLTLLGGFLKRAFHGDIRQRDRVKFEKADEKMDGGHAFRTMAAYEQWLLRDGGDEGRREVAVLRLMGLFDRPADAGCLNALLQPPVIAGLTEPLVGLAEDDWEFCLAGLEAAKLLTVNSDAYAIPSSALRIPHALDAHPHLREYFAKQLREKNPDTWRAAHRRLYEHLCATAPESTKYDRSIQVMEQLDIPIAGIKEKGLPSLEELQPLFQAVVHGCLAQLQREVLDDVYCCRIGRVARFSVNVLGAYSSTLAAVTCFFDNPRSQPSAFLSEEEKFWVLNEAADCLLALGRATEAVELLRAATVQPVGLDAVNTLASGDYDFSKFKDLELQASKEVAAQSAHGRRLRTLSTVEIALGEIAGAIQHAEHSANIADRFGNNVTAEEQVLSRFKLAEALFQGGREAEAGKLVVEGIGMAQTNTTHPLSMLYDVRTSVFVLAPQYLRLCDWIFADAERASWAHFNSEYRGSPAFDAHSAKLQEVMSLVVQCLKLQESTPKSDPNLRNWSLLEAAFIQIVESRVWLYSVILATSSRSTHPSSAIRLNGLGSKLFGWVVNLFRGSPANHTKVPSVTITAAEEVSRQGRSNAELLIGSAVDKFRRAGRDEELPKALLIRAWLRFLAGARTGPESAQEDLDEAWEISERGPMRLHMADIHLYRARLFGRRNSEGGVRNEGTKYPWESPEADLKAARKLIEQCGYWRRKEELEDAEKAILGSSGR